MGRVQDSTCGQRALYGLGLTQIPIINVRPGQSPCACAAADEAHFHGQVNNNCSTGSSALWLAKQAVQSGAVECAMAIGFEKVR